MTGIRTSRSSTTSRTACGAIWRMTRSSRTSSIGTAGQTFFRCACLWLLDLCTILWRILIHPCLSSDASLSPNDAMKGTNKRLNGHEVCDCYRKSPSSRPGNIENRYYHHSASGVSVAFLQWFNEVVGWSGHDLAWLNATTKSTASPTHPNQDPLQATDLFPQPGGGRPPFTSTQTGCRAGECNGTVPLPVGGTNVSAPPPHTWAHDVYGLLEHIVPQLQPDYLFFNSGLWGRLPGPYDMERLAQAANAAVQGSGGRAIFRTTTPKA